MNAPPRERASLNHLSKASCLVTGEFNTLRPFLLSYLSSLPSPHFTTGSRWWRRDKSPKLEKTGTMAIHLSFIVLQAHPWSWSKFRNFYFEWSFTVTLIITEWKQYRVKVPWRPLMIGEGPGKSWASSLTSVLGHTYFSGASLNGKKGERLKLVFCWHPTNSTCFLPK